LSVRIDHVLYAVSDLEAGAARFEEELGLESIRGGPHPDWGTANWIVPLGPDYLELVAVVDRAKAQSSAFGRMVLEAGEGLLAWSVATDNLDPIAQRLGLEIVRGKRNRPDGVRLTWRAAGIPDAMSSHGELPFFIQWEGPRELHPGGDHTRPAGVQWVEVAAREDRLRDWLGADLPVRFSPDGSGITRAAIGDLVIV
jgi:catechol 2,3-dioxygenase-like lactoylglutathione lyase family enzyme